MWECKWGKLVKENSEIKEHMESYSLSCCLPMTLASGVSPNIPACSPPASFSVHLAISAVTPAGSVHKSRGDNVGAVEEMMCVVCMDVTEET